MDDNIIFNLYFPKSTFIGSDESPVDLEIKEYEVGRYLSYYSGSLIEVMSGSTLEDVGVSEKYSSDSLVFDLVFNNNTYIGTGTDLSYSSTIYNFYSGAIIEDYSASSIGEIISLTIKDFIERPV